MDGIFHSLPILCITSQRDEQPYTPLIYGKHNPALLGKTSQTNAMEANGHVRWEGIRPTGITARF